MAEETSKRERIDLEFSYAQWILTVDGKRLSDREYAMFLQFVRANRANGKTQQKNNCTSL